ncbi:MAG: hypothetical protein V7L14_29600 [Nostoc sp.]|uniref:hypothetical protein n=1 Tax=Nostoc sp. TaxID=1180 RepID=UPI002FFC228B
MKIYVKSCGVSQEHDYCWLDEQRNIVEEPEVVKNVQYLIQSEAHSVVLARDDDSQLLLLVTGIITSRKDFRNRAIRISVAWVVKESDEQKNVQYLRAIASSILRNDKLVNGIEEQVIKGEKYGFEVNNFNYLKDLSDEKLEDENSTLEKNSYKSKIEAISDKIKYSNFKKDIAEELKKYCLPKPETFKILVVVTGIKSKSVLTQANVWRGLSTLIDQDENNADHHRSQNTFLETVISGIQNLMNRPPKSFIVIILVISLSLNALLFQHSIAQDREIKNIKFTFEMLQKQKQETDKKIQERDKKIEELYYNSKAKK